MNEIPYLLNIIPAIIVVILAMYFFKMFFDNEEKRRRVMLLDTLKKETTPIRLQAYERLIILLERIHPPRLISKVPNNDISKNVYINHLITTIEKEFDYNLSQQLYITTECWKMVELAKHSIVKVVQLSATDESVTTCEEFKDLLLKNVEESDLPTSKALRYLKDEAQKLW